MAGLGCSGSVIIIVVAISDDANAIHVCVRGDHEIIKIVSSHMMYM